MRVIRLCLDRKLQMGHGQTQLFLLDIGDGKHVAHVRPLGMIIGEPASPRFSGRVIALDQQADLL